MMVQYPLEVSSRSFVRFFPVPNARSEKPYIDFEATILEVKAQAGYCLRVQLWAKQEWAR